MREGEEEIMILVGFPVNEENDVTLVRKKVEAWILD